MANRKNLSLLQRLFGNNAQKHTNAFEEEATNNFDEDAYERNQVEEWESQLMKEGEATDDFDEDAYERNQVKEWESRLMKEDNLDKEAHKEEAVMANVDKEAPFEIYLENLTLYTAGDSRGKWISFPMEDSELQEAVGQIVASGEELIIMDTSTREDCDYLKDVIGKWGNVEDLNTVAKLIGYKAHPKVEAYIELKGSPTLPELANLLI